MTTSPLPLPCVVSLPAARSSARRAAPVCAPWTSPPCCSLCVCCTHLSPIPAHITTTPRLRNNARHVPYPLPPCVLFAHPSPFRHPSRFFSIPTAAVAPSAMATLVSAPSLCRRLRRIPACPRPSALSARVCDCAGGPRPHPPRRCAHISLRRHWSRARSQVRCALSSGKT
ncbi:hypothetical protein B0H14DRAFT_2941227 [Mycena olivaceomarginata]|nr:hypothetical protein B0H14DRAFT_2941227 [Mycena olivaceomarginata]